MRPPVFHNVTERIRVVDYDIGKGLLAGWRLAKAAFGHFTKLAIQHFTT